MDDFKRILTDTLSEADIELDAQAIDRLCKYYELLAEWNAKMNLTSITEPREAALKHFADSLMPLRSCELPEGASVIDVGTGAGFPGLPLKIARPDLRLTLLDSLSKRLSFLDEVCAQLGLTDVQTVHSRAEDGARTELRDSFDFAFARAVAELNILAEYCLPYVRVGGRFIALKGKDAEAELGAAENAVQTLGAKIGARHSFTLAEAGERAILEFQKLSPTPEQYPRREKVIRKKPL